MFTGKHVLRRQKYTCTWTPSKSPRVVNNTVVDRDSLYRHWIEKSPPTANIIIRSLPAANLQFTYFMEWFLVDINWFCDI